jgi:succinate dehydrogenase/fumarate reductase flavoprotein subunit
METEEYHLVKAKAVILATGGSGRLHIGGFMTTNHYGATGDGLVLGYRAGIEVFLHYNHPTGAVYPNRQMIWRNSEAGANLVNIDEQFVFERRRGFARPRSLEMLELEKVKTPAERQEFGSIRR